MFLIFGCGAFALDYNVYNLDSGQTVIIKQVKNNPIVNIDTWIKTGSINENDDNNGVSHFLEHLFFKGTQKHPPGDFDKQLESKGAITNAATSKDFTHYYVTIPSKYFDLAMELHADMLLNPLIPRKELEKERKVVMEEIAKDGNNPNEKVYENLVAMLYKTHPYKRKVLGTNEIIGKITREEILDYYNSHYGPQNMVTIIIGDVDVEHALSAVKENFKVQPRKIVKNINKPELPLKSKIEKTIYEPAQSGYMLIGYHSTNALNKDVYALDVLSTILGDGHSSILYQKIKEQKQLAYSISATNSTFKEDGIFAISANFTPENYEKLKKAIFEEVSDIQKHGVTQEQLNRAKSIIERDTYYSRESISSISSQIGYTTILSDNPRYYEEYLTNIKKVSLADVKRVATTYLTANKCAISAALPSEMKDVVKKTQDNSVVHKKTLAKDFAGVKKYSMDNGATLLINQNDVNDIVAININIKGGDFLEKIPATSNLTASVMMKGTKKYSSQELAEIMEENGIQITPSTSSDVFSINIMTTKSQLAKTLDILNEVVNNAAFDEFEIEKSKSTMLNSIKRSRDVPMNVALENYKSLIFENSVYSYNSKIYEKTLPKIQRDDILQYYNNIFNPKNIIISINGDVDENSIASKLAEIFKTKSAGEFNYQNYASSIAPITAQRASTIEVKDLKTAWLIIGWQTPGVLSRKECATLQVIDSILGSGMSSRLFKNVRDQQGLAYQLGSSFSPKILKGSFTIYIGTNPKTLSLAEKMMLAEVFKLKTEFVTDREIQEAKDKIIGNFIISKETNLAKASALGWFETSGRGFEYDSEYEQVINSVTASDILEVANKYFDSRYVISIVKSTD